MLDDTQSSMSIYPSNKTLSIGDKNVSGINIATQGANFSTNTIKIGNVNSTVNVGGNVTMKYGDCSITAKSLQVGYNTTGYTAGSEYSVSIWGLGDNNYNSFIIGIPIQLCAYTTYRMTITCRTNQPSMTVFIQNPAWTVIYDSLAVTNTFQTFVFTFTNGSSETAPLFYITTNDTVSAGKSFIWNYVKLETVCVGIGTTNPGYMLDVSGTARVTGELTASNLSFGNWKSYYDVNGLGKNYSCLSTQTGGVGLFNFALYQDAGSTTLNHAIMLRFSLNDVEKMRLTSTGFGIGTTSPEYKLDVAGSARFTGDLHVGTAHSSGTETGAYTTGTIYFAPPYGDAGSTIACRRFSTLAGSEQAELLLIQGNDIGDRIRLRAPEIRFDTYSDANTYDGAYVTTKMLIDSGGNVGIGTTTPAFPLHIVGYKTETVITGKYWTNTVTVGTTYFSQNASGSIYGSNDIITGGAFIVSSDRRIKTNIVDVQDDSALALFRQLKPKTYEYADKIQRGTESVYGFIAQEVQEVLPRASKKITDTVPNIYTLAPITGDTLTFDASKLEYDASGQVFKRLKLIKEDNKEFFVQILKVEGNTVQIDQILTETQVFVYGQEVNNFHTLDKNAIWTIATAALQEVDRQLQEEKEKTKTLQQNYVALQQNYVALQQNYESLLARILALESKGSAP